MIKNLIACLLLCLPVIVLAQPSPKIAGYFNKDWKEVQEKDKAFFYRTVEDQPDGLYLVKNYYMSGQLQMQPVICKVYAPKLEWEGNTIFYYENGKVKEEGFFINENRQGLHTFWHENGVKQKLSWHGDKTIKFHQYWSMNGEELLNKGNGTIEETRDDGSTYFIEIRDSIQVASYSFDKMISDTVYFMVDNPPQYTGGFESMHRVIYKNIVYPKSARRAGTEGTVFIGFIVDEQGKSRNHHVLKGVSAECDYEALRAAQLLNDWIPGTHNGKFVKVKFVYPIKFKLN
jgi:TonB family protein